MKHSKKVLAAILLIALIVTFFAGKSLFFEDKQRAQYIENSYKMCMSGCMTEVSGLTEEICLDYCECSANDNGLYKIFKSGDNEQKLLLETMRVGNECLEKSKKKYGYITPPEPEPESESCADPKVMHDTHEQDLERIIKECKTKFGEIAEVEVWYEQLSYYIDNLPKLLESEPRAKAYKLVEELEKQIAISSEMSTDLSFQIRNTLIENAVNHGNKRENVEHTYQNIYAEKKRLIRLKEIAFTDYIKAYREYLDFFNSIDYNLEPEVYMKQLNDEQGLEKAKNLTEAIYYIENLNIRE